MKAFFIEIFFRANTLFWVLNIFLSFFLSYILFKTQPQEIIQNKPTIIKTNSNKLNDLFCKEKKNPAIAENKLAIMILGLISSK